MPEQPLILEFVIKESFTPATLPLSRLAEYLADLAILYGERERVHFLALREGSTAILNVVDHEGVRQVRDRIRAARNKDAPPEVMSAVDRIDCRLRDDNAHGLVQESGAHDERLLYFPGVTQETEAAYGPFNEPGQLYGVPISVGGKKNIVSIHLEDGANVHICEATREIALQIAPLLFHTHIRVHGTGRYFRDADGKWELRSFRVSHFEKLDARPLAETVERLRTVTRRVGLDRDIVAKLAALREA